MPTDDDTAAILAAIAVLGERLERRIDELAEATGPSFERVDTDIARLEAAVQRVESSQSAARSDLTALRSELRRGFDRHEARIAALEAKRVT